MSWTEIFAVFIVSHLVGDFLFQTNWQAENKHGGLGPDPVRRAALLSHISTYTIAFVPAFVWLGADIGGWIVAVVAGVVVPHLIQDDGRLVMLYMRVANHTPAAQSDFVTIAVDQSFHILVLFGIALLAAA